MGNVGSRSSDSSPVRKCAKTEHHPHIHRHHHLCHHESHPHRQDNQQHGDQLVPPTQHDCGHVNNCVCVESDHNPACLYSHRAPLQRWEDLPYVALVEVYRYLSNNDKASLGRTCKAWLLPFTRPALWRRGNFRFDGDGDRRAMQFVALMGSALRHISVDCSASREKVNNRAKPSAVNLSLFLSSLVTTDNRKLSTICVRNLGRLFRYWIHLNGGNRGHVVSATSFDNNDNGNDNTSDVAINNNNTNSENNLTMNPLVLLVCVLKKQDNVQVLEMTNSGLLAVQAMTVLESLQHPSKVTSLVICDIVAQIERFHLARSPSFVTVMASFTALTDLSISEEYITHDLLLTLSNTLNVTLKRMVVKALYNTRRHPVEDSLEESWYIFCNRLSGLKVSFIVKGIFASRDFTRIVPTTIRLTTLDWDLGNALMDFRAFCLHMLKFKNSLRSLQLTGYIGVESELEYLYHIVQRLPHLQRLHIDSPLIYGPVLYLLQRYLRRCYPSKQQASDSSLKEILINGMLLEKEQSWYSYLAEILLHRL